MSDQQYLADLQEEVRKGKRFKYLGFWGHTAKQKGIVDKSCLSQWFPAKFEVDGIAYKNAEQFMMAQKAKLFADDEIFQKIFEAIQARYNLKLIICLLRLVTEKKHFPKNHFVCR